MTTNAKGPRNHSPDAPPTPGVVKTMDHADPNAMQDRTILSEDRRSLDEDPEVVLTRRLVETYVKRAHLMLDLGDFQQARADMEQARRLAVESLYPLGLAEEVERRLGLRPESLEE